MNHSLLFQENDSCQGCISLEQRGVNIFPPEEFKRRQRISAWACDTVIIIPIWRHKTRKVLHNYFFFIHPRPFVLCGMTMTGRFCLEGEPHYGMAPTPDVSHVSRVDILLFCRVFFLNRPDALLRPCSRPQNWQLLLKDTYRHTVVGLLMQSWHSTTGSCFPTAGWWCAGVVCSLWQTDSPRNCGSCILADFRITRV